MLPNSHHDNVGFAYSVHGSPKSYNDQMLESTPTEQLDSWLADTTANVVVAGHTHVQFHRILHGETHVIGVGSVGFPFAEAYKGGNVPPKILRHAEYAIIESCHEGELKVDLRQVSFDFKRA
jgi:predicted phosphodiesterase